MKTLLITGANRGIGLSLVKIYLKSGYSVYATVRSLCDIEELKQLENVTILECNLSSPESISNLDNSLKVEKLDLLINNAGVGEPDKLDQESMHSVYQVNAVAPLLVFQTLKSRLEASESPKVINISSRAGSIGDNGSGGWIVYRSSKAALNMITKTQSIDFPKIAFLALHPGFIQTRMVNFKGDMTPDEAACILKDTIDKFNLQQSGIFLHRDNYVLPW